MHSELLHDINNQKRKISVVDDTDCERQPMAKRKKWRSISGKEPLKLKLVFDYGPERVTDACPALPAPTKPRRKFEVIPFLGIVTDDVLRIYDEKPKIPKRADSTTDGDETNYYDRWTKTCKVPSYNDELLTVFPYVTLLD